VSVCVHMRERIYMNMVSASAGQQMLYVSVGMYMCEQVWNALYMHIVSPLWRLMETCTGSGRAHTY
jgi:hypothetical protein